VGLIFGGGFWLGTSQAAHPVAAQGGQPDETNQLFQPFWEAWTTVHQRYVRIDEVDDTKLMEGALAGMVDAVGDPNTAYMDPQFYATLTSDMQGEYEGIGATVKKDEATGGIMVVSTSVGSPARELLRQGDIIVQVEGADITRLPLTQGVNKIRGPAGTSVRLGVIRAGNKGLLNLLVQRAHIKRDIVTWTKYEHNIGYLALTNFTDNAAEDVKTALRDMNANKLKGLVFDMRGNPGGSLQTALDIASLFLKSGTIIVQRGRPGTSEIAYPVNQDAIAPDVPMVVLLDQSSASASELVGGALQDRGRAKVVGVVSFGKGSIQQWSGLSDGGGLRVTIAEFFKPAGGVINHVGIIPDIVVPWLEDQQRAQPDYDPQLTEAIWVLLGKM
jgi:carboxyl-terminal processing protease